MRALTHPPYVFFFFYWLSNNEVLAREGIDTLVLTYTALPPCVFSNNEVLAREGIDTISTVSTLQLSPVSRNEV